MKTYFIETPSGFSPLVVRTVRTAVSLLVPVFVFINFIGFDIIELEGRQRALIFRFVLRNEYHKDNDSTNW